MEKGYNSTVPLSDRGPFQNERGRPALGESLLTDKVLDELKRQSVNGCLLCSFDAWDTEDWD